MNELESATVQCPYCGEPNALVIDCSITQQNYVEDCQVCCRPMNVSVSLPQNDDVLVDVSNENE